MRALDWVCVAASHMKPELLALTPQQLPEPRPKYCLWLHPRPAMWKLLVHAHLQLRRPYSLHPLPLFGQQQLPLPVQPHQHRLEL